MESDSTFLTGMGIETMKELTTKGSGSDDPLNEPFQAGRHADPLLLDFSFTPFLLSGERKGGVDYSVAFMLG